MDEAAMRLQLEASHERAYQWALHCCGRDRAEAEDVLQTAYLKVLDGRARFEGRSSFDTWLLAVIWRTAADARRRVVRLGPHDPMDDDAELPSGAPSVAEAAEHAERREAIAAALEQMPLRQRQVMLLVFYHERTVEEAAEVLGIGTGSARTHYARGKERLRALLAAWEERHGG
jgi:RNA polymerase sigma-70 factor (ECF subfamily)